MNKFINQKDLLNILSHYKITTSDMKHDMSNKSKKLLVEGALIALDYIIMEVQNMPYMEEK